MGLTAKILEKLQGRGCHGPSISVPSKEKRGKIPIVGSPNVGKNGLFHRLTGTSYIAPVKRENEKNHLL